MTSDPGTYVLVLHCRAAASVQVGRWGDLRLHRGYYLYVGSAFGPGGVRARVGRHCRNEKSLHWHIDYLRAYAKLVNVWLTYDVRRREHQWATVLGQDDRVQPIPGFGCTDCDCESHLFYTNHRPVLAQFSLSSEGGLECLTCTDFADVSARSPSCR
ncbi:GIY-YIG nuclease family protein [Thiosocius teredinicola]|uniref:GIY-YIG nuclease family protein n=1 Tax=Thiosocius teredinicola TaxID=1973002 RepID=UPI000990FD88